MLYCKAPSADVFPTRTETTGGGYSAEEVAAALSLCGLAPVAIERIEAAQIVSFHVDFPTVAQIGKAMKSAKLLSALLHAPVRVCSSTSRHLCFELPNRTRKTIYLSGLEYVQKRLSPTGAKLCAILGADTANRDLAIDIAAAPHVMIAGTTGSGKSVLLHSIILSMIYLYTPSQLNLLLIDPKQTELTKYSGIPHLVKPVVTDEAAAETAIHQACAVMDERFKRMREAGAVDITQTDLPRIVIVIDELADLMMQAGGEGSALERDIIRIAQLGRAAGMHLIIATQRPSKQVLTGLIRANIPCKIALQTASVRESVVILDHKGAEALTGKGDAFLKRPDRVEETRFQGAFSDDADISAIVEYWKTRGIWEAAA